MGKDLFQADVKLSCFRDLSVLFERIHIRLIELGPNLFVGAENVKNLTTGQMIRREILRSCSLSVTIK